MSESVADGPQGTHWRDRKRLAWLLSLAVPAFVAAGPAGLLMTGSAWALWLPAVLLYGLVPLVDAWLGPDCSNPPEWAVPQLEADRYYRRITWALVPLLWLAFVFEVWFVARHDLPWHGWLAMVLIGGTIGGFCINLGHELGHRTTRLERLLARAVLAPTGYGHFSIEHNRGHHRDVATPQDPASSRMGESIWRFVLREMPGAARRAWFLEADRLRRNGRRALSIHNEIVQTGLLTLAFWAVLVVWLGWGALPFILAMSAWANFQLTSANYVEHYGLLRRRDAQGRYERPAPEHSWNSNHVLSNWALFHLQRHSDHHAHPGRRFQSLRHFDGAPQLPSGYFGMFLLAYVPWLWFRVMNPRLIEAVGGDPSRINFEPGRRAELMCRHGLRDRAAPA